MTKVNPDSIEEIFSIIEQYRNENGRLPSARKVLDKTDLISSTSTAANLLNRYRENLAKKEELLINELVISDDLRLALATTIQKKKAEVENLLSNQIKRSDQLISDMEKIINEKEFTLQSVSEQLNDAQSQNIELKKQIEVRSSSFQNKVQLLTEQLEAEKGKCSQAIADARQDANDAELKFINAQDKIIDLKAHAKYLEREANERRKQFDEWNNQQKSLFDTISELKTKLAVCESELSRADENN